MKYNNYFLLSLLLCFTISLFGQGQSYYLTVKKGQLRHWLDGKQEVDPVIAAHRGGRFYAGFPENALETFEHTLRQTPAFIECDVEMTSDNVLVLLHDRSLDRTTTGTGKIKEQAWSYVQTLSLIDDLGDTTAFKVPTLEEALQWTKGKTILELDVKRGVPFEKVIAAVEEAKVEDYVIMITYSVQDAQKVYQLNPDLMISISIRNEAELKRVKESGIPPSNLIAFTGTSLSDPALYKDIHNMGILTILGTMGNIDRSAKARGDKVYQQCIDKGIDVLATDRPVQAAQAIDAIPKKHVKGQYYSIKKKN